MGSELKATTRRESGKGDSRKLRKIGSIPAVVYGFHKNAVQIILDKRETEKIIESGATRQIHNLLVESPTGDTKLLPVMFKDIQRDPLSRAILHVDLYEIQKGQMISMVLPINLIGKPFGVTDQGGSLQFVTRALRVRCSVDQIPVAIDVNIDQLKLNESIHVKEIAVSETFKILDDLNKVIVSVATIKATGPEEAPKEAEAEEAAAPAEGEPAAETESK
jgi:large subunit ribosomal protein L25